MHRLNGRDVLKQLITAYEQEARLYAGLEEAARRQRNVLVNGRDPEQLGHLAEQQRVLAEHIGQIEAAVAPLRAHWEKARDGARAPRVLELAQLLDRLLEDLADQIHRIVQIEKANSEALVALRMPTGACE